MSDANQIIMRYEKARQESVALEKERRMLVSHCENIDTCEDNHNQIVSFGENCFVAAWNTMVEENNQCRGHDHWVDHFSFDEVFTNGELLNDAHVCDNCKKAYEIKKGPLAAAKKDLGIAKRQLSAMGKKLIGGEA